MPETRVLLIAESANPEWTSVPLEGWSHARAIAGLVDAHVVTHVRNQDAICRAGWREGKEFTSLDTEAVARPVYLVGERLRGGTGKGWTTVVAFQSLSYYYFEHMVWRQFGERIRAGEFDLVHRLTPLSPTIPSLIAAKCRRAGVPFVWGPVNGGVPWPKGFDAVRRREREWLSYVRSAYKLLPGYRSTRRSAAALIIGSRDTWKQMPQRRHGKCVYIPENGVDAERFTKIADPPESLPLRVAFVGRLVPYKGVDMLLEAAAPLIREGKVVVDIIGDGPELPRLRSFVEREGIAAGVKLDGRVEHAKLQDRLVQSSLFGFPSVREFGGAVVLEAMALGLVPIIVDYAGPSELVTDETGYRVPIASRQCIVERFRRILEDLVLDPSPIRAIGLRARERVMSRFTWSTKATQTLEVYDWLLGRRADKPDFGMPLR